MLVMQGKMRILVFLFLTLLNLVFASSGNSLFHMYLFPYILSDQSFSVREHFIKHVRAPLGPSVAPTPPPISVAGPRNIPLRRHFRHHHHRTHRPHHAVAPSPSKEQGCDQVCTDPLTSNPYGSPCGCVFPMKVRLLLSIAPYAVFPQMRQLESEVAIGTYLEQSQVKIMGASADSQNQGRTVVDINLVPLGEKFDNTTAVFIYERFVNKKVPLNLTLFGHYEVIYIIYPGIPSSPPYEGYEGSGPKASSGSLPVTADFVGKTQRMKLRMNVIIGLSAFIVVLVFVGAIFMFVRLRKVRRPSTAVGPTFTSSINKRSGIGSILSDSTVSSTLSTMAPCLLSVKTFSLAELEKATNKFSSKRILGEGGFGCVYRGIMEDGSEVAIKLLIRYVQSGGPELIAEGEMLSRLHHCNLVKLIGICIEGRRRCLVYELVPNGSVESHLHGVDKINGPLDWEARIKIALGAARGLAYLHEDSNPRVIHRDFKASNILLEHDFTPKVSDFGLAREATEGSHHICSRVMGTFGYVAPEYAMTGHLLVKSDVYSYGVVLLELISGRKPVDMSQLQGQESLVTWARPLLTSREGLEQLVDPSLAGGYEFDDMAKVAAIASMCVHPEVTHRPFMGEVVQALKLIYNDTDETCGDCFSQKDSSCPDYYFKGDAAHSDSSWWNASDMAPHLTYGHASPLVTMEYSSGPLDTENRPYSSSVGDGISLAIRYENRSGPLKTVRSKPAFSRLLRGSMSEDGLLSRRIWSDRNWA